MNHNTSSGNFLFVLCERMSEIISAISDMFRTAVFLILVKWLQFGISVVESGSYIAVNAKYWASCNGNVHCISRTVFINQACD